MDETFYASKSREVLWLEYRALIQEYEFYWGIALKLSAFFFTLSGAIGGFYFTHRSAQNAGFLLLLPMLLGTWLFLLNMRWANTVKTMGKAFTILSDNLELVSAKKTDRLQEFLSIVANGCGIVAVLALVFLIPLFFH